MPLQINALSTAVLMLWGKWRAPSHRVIICCLRGFISFHYFKALSENSSVESLNMPDCDNREISFNVYMGKLYRYTESMNLSYYNYTGKKKIMQIL